MKKTQQLLIIAGLATALFAGCGKSPQPSTTTSVPPGKKSEYTVALVAKSQSNPVFQAALDPLAPGDAFAFLRRHAGARDGAGASEVIAVLGSTPLALELAAARCRLLGTPLSDYAAQARLLISSAPRRQGRSAGLAASARTPPAPRPG